MDASQPTPLSKRERPQAIAPVHVVILGAGYAGVLCANRLASKGGRRVRVSLVNASPHFRERVRDHQVVGARPPKAHALPSMLHPRVALQVAEVTGMDAKRHVVQTREGDLHYDHVVVALGSESARPFAGAHHLSSLDGAGADAIAAALSALDGARVAVVGGGPTAVEIACAIATRRKNALDVTLVAPDFLAGLAPKLREKARAVVERRGIAVRQGRVLRADKTRVGVTLSTSSGRIETKVAILATGLQAVPLVQTFGLALKGGRLALRPTLQALDDESVWGAGDCAAAADVSGGCKSAMPMGAHVADNLLRTIGGLTPLPFAFADVASFLDLGRGQGVLQVHVGTRRVVVGGRLAAVAKALINAWARLSPKGERWRIRYAWPKRTLAPATARDVAPHGGTNA